MAHLEALDIRSPRELLQRVSETDPVAAEGLLREARGFDPAIVINRAHRPEHRQLGLDMGLALEDYFGRRVLFLGAIEEDERSLSARAAGGQALPDSRFVGAPVWSAPGRRGEWRVARDPDWGTGAGLAPGRPEEVRPPGAQIYDPDASPYSLHDDAERGSGRAPICCHHRQLEACREARS
jgi:hypothetical protein